MSAPFVTSVRVEKGAAHDYVTVWIRGANVGTLCVGKGDGEALRRLLLADTVFVGEKAWQDAGCPDWPARTEPVRPREPDDEVFAAPPRHAMTEKGVTVRDATDAEQLAALRAVDPRTLADGAPPTAGDEPDGEREP